MTLTEFNRLNQAAKLELLVKAKPLLKRSSGKMGRNTRKLIKLYDFYVAVYYTTHDTDITATENIEKLLKDFSD